MVEHMECPRAFLGKLCKGTLFFSVKNRPEAQELLYRFIGAGVVEATQIHICRTHTVAFSSISEGQRNLHLS